MNSKSATSANPLALNMQPIGVFRSNKKSSLEAARQATADHSSSLGVIELLPHFNFEQALTGLETFSHLWVIFVFHHSLSDENCPAPDPSLSSAGTSSTIQPATGALAAFPSSRWKTMVMPPRGTDQKVGVFASRSPYRPNPIGMSALKIDHIEGRKIFVQNHDLLDETPILDIKPYIPYADSFPEANSGWISGESYTINFSSLAEEQCQWLVTNGVDEIKNVILSQLEFDPFNSQKKRVRQLSPAASASIEISTANHNHTTSQYVFSFRTWRVQFSALNTPSTPTSPIQSEASTPSNQHALQIEKIFSGYNFAELADSSDPYNDKNIHREFIRKFAIEFSKN